MTNHVSLLQYQLYKDKDNDIAGRPMSCLRVDFSWFLPFTPNLNLPEFWSGFSLNCALYIVNVLKYAYVI